MGWNIAQNHSFGLVSYIWILLKCIYLMYIFKYQFESVQILITTIYVAYRKSYLFIMCPISTKKLMKYVIRSSLIQF